MPPCFEWLARTAKTDPRLGAAMVALAFSFEDERLSRAYLADALRRFGAAPEDFHERAAWIGRIAERDDFTRATMFSLCLLYTSPSPRDRTRSRMPSSA